MSDEKVDMKKFAVSFVQAKPWMKNLRFILGALIIFMIGITIYRAYFMKTQATSIRAEKGSTVHIHQETEKRKPLAQVIPYVDGSYGRYNNGFDSWNDGEDGWKVEVGLRAEFDGLFDFLFKRTD